MLKALFLVACMFPLPALAGGCVQFGATVTLTGRYVLDVLAPQPPGDYDRRRDAGRTADVLYLASPLCVASDDLSDGVPAATDVQVLCPDLLAGSKIAVTGRLLGAHTGNGHTPVLLVCPAYYQPARLRPLPLRGGSV
jgi:hypothetical protein